MRGIGVRGHGKKAELIVTSYIVPAANRSDGDEGKVMLKTCDVDTDKANEQNCSMKIAVKHLFRSCSVCHFASTPSYVPVYFCTCGHCFHITNSLSLRPVGSLQGHSIETGTARIVSNPWQRDPMVDHTLAILKSFNTPRDFPPSIHLLFICVDRV